MNRTSNDEAAVVRRIGALKHTIDTSLMELTEVEVLINAHCRKDVDCGELERTRLMLTNAIVEMDAELKRLQSGAARAEREKDGVRSVS